MEVRERPNRSGNGVMVLTWLESIDMRCLTNDKIVQSLSQENQITPTRGSGIGREKKSKIKLEIGDIPTPANTRILPRIFGGFPEIRMLRYKGLARTKRERALTGCSRHPTR